MRANVVNQAIGTACIGTLALVTGSTALNVVAIVILVGFIGMVISLRMERGVATPVHPTATFPMTARWNWYVAGYTFCYTIATAVAPHQILPIFGSDLSSAQMQSRKETRSSFSCLFSRKLSTMSKNSTTS
jgi:hypothetical protein